MAKHQPLQISLDDLAAAWRARRRPDWPPTFTEAMAHPMLRPLVRAEAVRRALAARHADQQARPPAAAAPHRPPQPGRLNTPPSLFDRKRAAAGDRDD